ncbi:MAG: class I SAM-dependent methyltransferase, partial [Firmicutes bacterium]|nr:class I SAM-dependent methyltransferase [Bacillota bacterium]
SKADVKIGGTFSSPKVSLDVKAAAEEAVKNALNQGIEKLTGDKSVGEAISKQADKLRAEAKSAGDKLVEAARKEGDKMVEQAKNNIEAQGLADRITVLEGDARQVLAQIAAERTKPEDWFDFIFIDAGKGHYPEFWGLSLPMMAKDCIVASDNVLFKGLTASDVFEAEGKKKRKHRTIVRRLRKYLDYLSHAEGMVTSVLAVGDGLAVTTVGDPELVRSQWNLERLMESEHE